MYIGRCLEEGKHKMSTVSELAAHLQASSKTVQDLINKGVITKQNRGKYDLDLARKEYILHVREVAAGRTKTGDLDLQEERARLAKEQADSKEMENAVERGDLVYIENVAKQFELQLTKVRTKLLAVPTKVAPEAHIAATVKEVQSLIEAEIIEALNELVGYDKEAAVEES
jgi:phage terminase Nu1 subunit (DNA packaging protein)